MSQVNFNRIVYSPEVQVYILPGGSDAPIDISNDIIEGTITRRTEAVSTASFLIQSRKNKENDMLLSQLLRPMDRVVIYLKKTKPILIFSGYLDLVPVFQAMPEPFVIEASCTLKRLEFTYWDPNLPKVYETLQQYGFVPKLSEGGISFFDPNALSPVDLQTTPSANGTQEVGANTTIQDTGFAAMLNFLLVDVGGWSKDNVWIEPIPEAWMQRAALLFQVNNDWEERYGLAQEWLKTFLSAGGSAGGGGGEDGGSGGASASLDNASTIRGKIEADIQSRGSGSQMKADDFIDAGQKYNIDPRFLAALAASETSYGTAPNSSADRNNAFGYKRVSGPSGTYQAFSSFRAGVFYVADVMRNKNYYIGDDNNQTVEGFLVKWNLSSGHQKKVLTDIWKSLATDDAPVNVNKPYSITAQGIGNESLNATEPTSPNATNPSSRTGGSNKILSVYLEAGHSGTGGSGPPGPNTTMQPGYQMQPGATRVGGDYTEPQQNAAFIKAMKRAYNALSEDEKKRLDIQFATETSRPRGWAGDIYLSIHHDPSAFSGSSIGIAGPSSRSKQGTQSSTSASPPGKPGEPGPNRYADGGAGFVKPSDGEGGRDSINNDSGLHKNSAQLIAFIGSKVRSLTAGDNFINDLTTVSGNTWNRMQNYYGFYYTNSSAAAIVELPSTTGELKYDRDKLAGIFVKALLDYQKLYKEKGQQKSISAGNEAIGDGTINTGDDSPASKVIKAALKIVNHNESKWDIGYSMDDRSPYADVEEVLRKKGNLDCSSFIAACMKSAKLIPKDKYADTTGTLEADSVQIQDKTKFKPGHLFIRTGEGGAGHVIMVVGADGKCVECTRPDQSATKGPNRGPQFKRVAQDLINDSGYNLWKHNLIGDTENPPSAFGGSDTGGEGGTGSVDSFLQAKTVAFNVAFNFPGSLLESILLTGDRALENDVKLFESVAEICKASMRTFASLPNGDFMAWYPDYFNLSGRNPWLRVSTTEIKSCTISLSDRQLVTHVYVLGNPFGLNQADGSNIRLEWYEKLLGSGVVTIERPYLLDSFLRPFEDEDLTDEDIKNLEGISELSADQIKNAKKRPRGILEGQGSAYKFLERYGARPYLEKIPTIRHPIFEFFYAYHTFIQKWAEQFITRVELTFMPELFPGMIVELDVNPQIAGYPKTSVTFYVKEVTHSFSYQSGFYTEALLMAPGTTNRGNEWAMALVSPPDKEDPNAAKRKRVKVKIPPKTTSRTGGNRGTRTGGAGGGQTGTSYEPTDANDGDN